MTSQNGKAPSIDLTAYTPGACQVTIAGKLYDLPDDVPLEVMLRAETIMGKLDVLSKADGTEVTEEQSRALDDAIWSIVESVTNKAEPPLERPLRELLSRTGALVLLGFLSSRWNGQAANLKGSLPSQQPSAARSPSPNSRKARRSTKPARR